MASSPFIRQLSILTFLTACLIVLAGQVTWFDGHLPLYWSALGAYFVITLFLYLMGRKLAVGANPNSFTLFVLGSGFGKMLLTMVILVVYLKYAQPATKYFILPFLGVYVIYTVFETYVLMKVGRAKPAS